MLAQTNKRYQNKVKKNYSPKQTKISSNDDDDDDDDDDVDELAR